MGTRPGQSKQKTGGRDLTLHVPEFNILIKRPETDAKQRSPMCYLNTLNIGLTGLQINGNQLNVGATALLSVQGNVRTYSSQTRRAERSSLTRCTGGTQRDIRGELSYGIRD